MRCVRGSSLAVNEGLGDQGRRKAGQDGHACDDTETTHPPASRCRRRSMGLALCGAPPYMRDAEALRRTCESAPGHLHKRGRRTLDGKCSLARRRDAPSRAMRALSARLLGSHHQSRTLHGPSLLEPRAPDYSQLDPSTWGCTKTEGARWRRRGHPSPAPPNAQARLKFARSGGDGRHAVGGGWRASGTGKRANSGGWRRRAAGVGGGRAQARQAGWLFTRHRRTGGRAGGWSSVMSAHPPPAARPPGCSFLNARQGAWNLLGHVARSRPAGQLGEMAARPQRQASCKHPRNTRAKVATLTPTLPRIPSYAPRAYRLGPLLCLRPAAPMPTNTNLATQRGPKPSIPSPFTPAAQSRWPLNLELNPAPVSKRGRRVTPDLTTKAPSRQARLPDAKSGPETVGQHPPPPESQPLQLLKLCRS